VIIRATSRPKRVSMRFLINNRVIFDEDNLTLALADENADPVVLTAIANRLLALLVKNNNILISRDFIYFLCRLGRSR
ncbi:hypothetical protein K5M49_09690, partial [Serratia marcescens]|nr:hypothetical protein [Serratia marcescens]